MITDAIGRPIASAHLLMKTICRLSLAALLAGSLVGCSPVRVAEELLLGNHFTRTTGNSYGTGSRNQLDVYRPRARGKALPVVVFLYGGRWQTGSKEDYRLLGNAFTRRGFVVVVPDYRFYPETIFPGWVEDAALAVRWTQKNIGRFGGDSAQIYVVGHSSGAHTTALLALDERYLNAAGVPANSVLGFVSLAGPVETQWTDPDVQALMGPPDKWLQTYPSSHIDGSERPLLLLHGSEDKTVSPQSSIRLGTHIREGGGCARVIMYPGVGHVELVVALTEPRLKIAPVMDDVIKFIREVERSNRACPAPYRPGSGLGAGSVSGDGT